MRTSFSLPTLRMFTTPCLAWVLVALCACGGQSGGSGAVTAAEATSDSSTPGVASAAAALPGGTLVLAIDGPDAGVTHDMLKVNGQAQLGGDLQLVFSDTYTPAPGQRLRVIEATGGLSGGFVSVTSNKSFKLTTAQDANTFTVIVQ